MSSMTKNTPPTRPPQFNVQLTFQDEARLKALKTKLGLSKAAIIRMALILLARSEGIEK